MLRDRGLTHAGDLGWTLEYATAWCYKHLIGNQTGVADAIDRVRELESVEQITPFIMFDFLDKALFRNKLRGMVYLRWKTMMSCSPGTTSAPGVVSGIPRVCIELNLTPFEDDDSDVDDLLDVLIHQMIHAFFLVACGAQPKSAKQDGRLLDGLHFGVIMSTIRDITRRCREGGLDVIFYAANRAGNTLRRNDCRQYISVDPRGSASGSAPADGQTHCNHDNRQVRPAQIKNWQVENYSVSIDLGMDGKGDVIWDLDKSSVLVSTDRLKGPPSSSYVELIWDDKRVMVPREKALKHKSLKKPLEKDEKMELKVPECSESVFVQIYNFFTCGSTQKDVDQVFVDAASRAPRTKGPPVLIPSSHTSIDSPVGMINHLQIFKVAESMKFEELQEHVMKRLWEMPATTDDPIKALKLLYNDKDNSGPVHAELHKWARHFLAKREGSNGNTGYEYGWQGYQRNFAMAGYGFPMGSGNLAVGTSNYEKLGSYHLSAFRELYHRNLALKDDCKLVAAMLCQGTDMDESYEPEFPGIMPSPAVPGLPQIGSMAEITDTAHVSRRIKAARSWYNDPWDVTRSSAIPALPSSLPWYSDRRLADRPYYDDFALPSYSSLRQPTLEWGRRSTPLGLPAAEEVSYILLRLQVSALEDILTGQKFVRWQRPLRYGQSIYAD